jgi:hypothetical protein
MHWQEAENILFRYTCQENGEEYSKLSANNVIMDMELSMYNKNTNKNCYKDVTGYDQPLSVHLEKEYKGCYL